MKFGKYLKDSIPQNNPDYTPSVYLDYDTLKRIIKALAAQHLSEVDVNSKLKLSMTAPRPTDELGQEMHGSAAGGGDAGDSEVSGKKKKKERKSDGGAGEQSDSDASNSDDDRFASATPETFYHAIEKELKDIETFTLRQIKRIREGLKIVEQAVGKTGDKDKMTCLHPMTSGRQNSSSSSSGLSSSYDGASPEKDRAGASPSSAAGSSGGGGGSPPLLPVKDAADVLGVEFLTLEKYVNLNFMAFHKILKKHDKCLPNKCKNFYVSRMHAQAWVKGDFSDVVVQLSRIYSSIRGDHAAVDKGGDSQAFMRSTTKYWVNTEDVSKVKYTVLQHLPVFLQKTSTGNSDSQLTNSVYLDNAQLELYHGRLDKTPGAQAVRLRWYGNGDPDPVFVERKTHRESWTGDVSVKERFIIKEKSVSLVMTGKFDVKEEKQKMKDKGKKDAECNEYETLANEICQAVNSKVLVPTMRTQYMRTAFQIPFDATVRVSLDTNLCMINERGYDLENGKRWRRDPAKALKHNDITRFPHAVLEIKLEVKEGSSVPPWVEELQASGMLYEVHKFSKFIHGCATLLHEDVQAVPYWVDDHSVRDSIVASGAAHILAAESADLYGKRKNAGPGANQLYPHLLPHGTVGETGPGARTKVMGQGGATTAEENGGGATNSNKSYQSTTAAAAAAGNQRRSPIVGGGGGNAAFSDDEDAACCGLNCGGCWPRLVCCPRPSDDLFADIDAPTAIQKVEPKIYFANERTFLHWLHMGVVLSTLGSGVLAFAKDSQKTAQMYGLALLPISMCFILYALSTMMWRSEQIRMRVPGRWDDPFGPWILSVVLCITFGLFFFFYLYEIVLYDEKDF